MVGALLFALLSQGTLASDTIDYSVVRGEYVSVFDVLAMLVGFLLAWRLPVWASVAVVIALELLVPWSMDKMYFFFIELNYALIQM